MFQGGMRLNGNGSGRTFDRDETTKKRETYREAIKKGLMKAAIRWKLSVANEALFKLRSKVLLKSAKIVKLAKVAKLAKHAYQPIEIQELLKLRNT